MDLQSEILVAHHVFPVIDSIKMRWLVLTTKGYIKPGENSGRHSPSTAPATKTPTGEILSVLLPAGRV